MLKPLLYRSAMAAAMVMAGWGVSDIRAEDEKKAAGQDVKTTEETVRDITMTVPETWTKKAVSGFRAGQFEVPAVEGDTEPAEVVIFHFGPNGGGPVQDNINRWAKQFDEDGRKLLVYDGASKQGKYVLVELTGTWNKPVGPPIAMKTTKMPGARFLGMILKVEDKGDYYIRLTGPNKTVQANAKALRVAVGAKLDAESARKVEEKAAE